MPSAARISVLMTVYNGMPFLPAAIESVLSQQGADFECLAVDDGSTDGSRQWLTARRHPRLRVECNPQNLGQTAALNRGLELSQTAYIARLDQDDLCLPGRLQQQAQFLDDHPEVSVVGCRMQAMDVAGRLLRQRFGRVVACDGEAAGLLLQGLVPVQHPSVMYRRDAILNAGGYDPLFGSSADYELWARLIRYGGRIRALPDFLGCYRVHGGQQSSRHAAAHHACWHKAHEQLVAACGADDEAAGVSRLLRLDLDWWRTQQRQQLLRSFEALRRMLLVLPQRIGLGTADHAVAARMVRARVGFGPELALRLRRWPETLFQPAVLAASPLLLAKQWAEHCWPNRLAARY